MKRRTSPVVPLVILATVLTLTMSSCGIPEDRQVRNIRPDKGLAALMATRPSTTSTTTTTAPITVPETTEAPETTVAPPQTLPPTDPPTTIADTTVEYFPLFFVVGDRFVEERRQLPVDATLTEVIDALATGPISAESPTFARSVVQPGDVQLSAKDGLVTADLDARFRDLQPPEQRRLIGQLVLTLTSQRSVGQVLFTLGDQPIDVPRGDTTFGTGSLARGAFSDLIENPSLVTTLPPTTVPSDLPGPPSRPGAN
jgi:Sporulation and spore germination